MLAYVCTSSVKHIRQQCKSRVLCVFSCRFSVLRRCEGLYCFDAGVGELADMFGAFEEFEEVPLDCIVMFAFNMKMHSLIVKSVHSHDHPTL